MSEGQGSSVDKPSSNGGGRVNPGSDASGQTVPKTQTLQSQQQLHLEPIDNGLQLRLKGKKQSLESFSYTWALTTKVPRTLDWTTLSKENIPLTKHIRYHPLLLQDGKSLPEFVGTLNSDQYTQALILINTDNTYQIDPKIFSGDEQWALPILMVTSESGKQLDTILSRYPQNTEVKVSLTSIHADAEADSSLTENWINVKQNDGDVFASVGARTSHYIQDKATRVERMLFSEDGSPIIVSEDSALFQLVMAECSAFEATRQSHEMGKKLLTTLIQRFHDTFKKDFLFYIALAYRARFVQSKQYQSKVVERFVDLCIVKFEELEPQTDVATALNGFFEREKFVIYCNMNPEDPQLKTEVNVNWFLEHAFDKLMKKRKMEQFYCEIYPTMLWITTYLSFCAKRAVEEADEKKWHDCFLKEAHRYSLTSDNIKGLKMALSLGKALNLPAELTFSTSLIGELLAPTDSTIVRSFSEQRDAITALKKHFPSTEEFMKYIVIRLREAYNKSLQESLSNDEFLKVVTKKGSSTKAIKDGILLLDVLLNITKNGSLQRDKDFQQWILLLVNVIKRVDHNPFVQGQCLQELLSQKYSVTRKYYNYIIEQTRIILKGLPVKYYHEVYKCDPAIWSSENLEEYLNDYSISTHALMTEDYWEEFFDAIIEKFPGAAKQKTIHKFLMKVADNYQKRGDQSQLIVHLLQLRVSGLCAMSSADDKQAATEFENMLRGFIRKNRLKSSLICQTKDILGYISSTKYSFQEVVLGATVKEIITDPRDLLEPSLSKAMNTTVSTLMREQTWVQSEPSVKQKFCFDFVNACCSRISIFSSKFDCIQSIDWIKFDKYSSLITELGRLYTKSKPKLCDPFPAMSPSSIVQSYFDWIQDFHSMFKKWKLRLQEEKASYDEIDWYFQNQRKLFDFADIIAAANLVVSKDAVQCQKDIFFCSYRMLNQLILRYISGDSKSGWCSVSSILSKYEMDFPPIVHSQLCETVIFPDETEKAIEYATIPTPIDEKFNPPYRNVYLLLSNDCSLVSLRLLVQKIHHFLAPVEHMDLLVYFQLHHSYFFSVHMHHVLPRKENPDSTVSAITPEQLQKAVECTKALLVKVLKGTATYWEITAEEQLDLNQLNVEVEFSLLLDCQSLPKYWCGATGLLKGMKSILKLVQFAEPILILKKVFEQYGLEGCLNDLDFKEIYEIALALQDSEERSKITIDEAKHKWKVVYEALCLKEDASPKSLELFSKVADSADFYHLLKEKELIGALGYSQFYYKIEVITRHQELDEFEEMVLNHLYVAFKFIFPFLDPSQSLHSLMSAVAGLDLPETLSQLETVRKNMHYIQYWFSYSEDTTENVSAILNGILESGEYSIETITPAIPGRSNLQLVIKYKLSFVSTSYKATLDQPTHESSEQVKTEVVKFQNRTMTSEQINDFVNKIKLLKGEDHKVQKFLHLNEVAYKLLTIFSKLQELGNPIFLKEKFTYTWLCSDLLPIVKKEVSATQGNTVLKEWMDEVGKWMHEVEKLYIHNKWLLFFRVPKLKVLYKTLTADKPSITTIIQEIGFLFQRNAHTSEGFQSAIKSAVEACRQDLHSGRSPMDIVGSFLDHQCLFDHAKLPIRYKKYASLSQSINVLYNAAGYNHSQLVSLILEIYDGLPEAFEFLRCKLTTTEQELRLFMKRAIRHPRLYLVVEVNHLPYQLQEVLLQLYLQLKHQQPESMQTHVYFIETAPSLFQEVSYLKYIQYKEEELLVDMTKLQSICKEAGLQASENWSCIQLVYSNPGNGKTHYIRSKMKYIPESHQVTIAVNEAFTSVSAIEKLRTLPRDEGNCAIFFNFTVFPPVDGTDEAEKEHYQQLMKDIRWFFFELLIFNYVEDPATGLSFYFPAGLSWALYVEVPSRATCGTPADFLECFKEEVPVLALLGTPVFIYPDRDYYIDDDVQLVCKYLRAYENHKIDSLYGDIEIKFSTDPSLSDVECKQLLQNYMSDHVKETKITQKLFIKYMKRRCAFLDNFSAFNYNTGSGEYIVLKGQRQATDTRHLGSTLMETMLKEVADFCDPSTKENWSQKAHQQLIYDFADGGSSLGLISLLPDDPKLQADKDTFIAMGVEIPSLDDLYSRAVLDKYLSRALGVPLSKDGRLSPIDKKKYVLTLDFTLKMLNIHERYECGVPVIIEGETGVGKTALIEMLSELWNYSWVAQLDVMKDHIVHLMHRELEAIDRDTVDDSQHSVCVEALCNLRNGEEVTEEMFDTFAQLSDSKDGSGHFYSVLKRPLLKLEEDLIFSMLNLKLKHGEKPADIFTAMKTEDCSKSTAHLLYVIFSATVKSTFQKMNVHADLQPKEIEQFFAKIHIQAEELQKATDAAKKPAKVPFVTAYLDEINTASCLGLFKEIIVDRTINGKPIPQNVFIIASCNPHRGDFLTIMHEKNPDSWLKGTYYVRKLHPTLEYLKWDYGSLNKQQEEEYVNAKMKMLSPLPTSSSEDIVPSLTALIVASQQNMRDYALEQLQNMRDYAFEQLQLLNIPSDDDWLKHCANSSVSQRDIQRVFKFFQWLMKTYIRFNRHNESCDMHCRRAMMVSLGIVYFMRLDSKYRSIYKTFLDKHDKLGWEISFSKAYEDELQWYIDRVNLPPNIAKTEALMENVFATIVCTMTHTPLIIVGDPGSSKTLSFAIVAANLKGKESKIETFRDTDIFQSLDLHFYQCSRRTTSNDIEKTFKKAITRQHSLARIGLPVLCVVFMDEAGLPGEKLESLKVLHYYLDKREVSFVAISNHVLDASKTNRAVSLFRPKPIDQDLHALAKIGIVPADQVPSMIEKKLIHHFCDSYKAVICNNKFKVLFGLRDFIHFVIYLRCKRKYLLTTQLILRALERNFNGSENFHDICDLFFKQIPVSISVKRIHFRSILDILKDSIEDQTTSEGDDVHESTVNKDRKTDCITPGRDVVHKSTQSEYNQAGHTTSEGNDIHRSIQSEVRYKLIIDPSEDDSLVRLLFTYGVLQRNKTRLYICSDFPGDSQSRINTVIQIMHSVAVGHTILMCQTDEIHESFYDLFNQRFRSITDSKHGTRYYTNVAIGAHSKLCRVNPKFQCIVVIKKSEVEDTPPPFLNRFEKYYLTHQSLLKTVLGKMPCNLRILLKVAQKKTEDFISCVKQPNLYGCTEETLDSLLLTLLPPTDYKYVPLLNQQVCYEESDELENIQVFILKTLLTMLQKNAGFHIPQLLAAEVQEDADHIFKIVLANSAFEETMSLITHEKAAGLIDEALDVLYHGPEPVEEDAQLNNYFEVYTDSLLVIAVLMQWLVNYLCKKLMQLVPPEAIPVHCSGIPTVYIANYLRFQEHFSLKELMERQLHDLRRNDWDRSVCPTKLLCFTRSSTLIHQLPSEYPTSVTDTQPVENYGDFVREHIFKDQELLMICKVSLGYSQDKLETLLLQFTNSNCQVLLLIANMQELSKKMINHLRIMIEEAESKMGNNNKLFVLLLHFSPVMFFNPCYPSLFLQGWSHHYLDTVARGLLTREGVKSVVDIKKCFYHYCFPNSHSDFDTEKDQMAEALKELLPEAIPIIASQVAFTCEGKDGNTVILNASQRTEVLQKSFNRDTGSGNIGRILTVKFCKYWTPQLMVQQIDQVSRSMYAQDSTLNITDSVQSIVRSAFFDFLVYMFIKINEDHNINLSEKDDFPIVCAEQLFLGLLTEIRVPELAQLKILSTTLSPQQVHTKAKCIFKFPFFKYVCEILEKAIDESREDVNQEEPSTSSLPTQKKSKQKMEKLYMEAVMARVKDKLEGCLGVTVNAMDNEQGDTIWRQYFDDFITFKLDLESNPSDLTREIIDAYISPLRSMCSDALSQLVSLHVCFHVHHLDLRKVTRILSPIFRVQNEMAALSPNVNRTVTLTPATLMEQENTKSASRMPPTIGSFIVTMLFDFISNMDASASESLQCWYRSYRDIMSIPAMVENILSNLAFLPESQLNIMHATYLVMECYCNLSSQRGYQVFTDLHSKQGAKCIHLREVMTTGLKTMQNAPSPSVQGKEGYCLQSFIEGLFSFFFSKHRVLFAEEDCKYFLEFANNAQAIDNCVSINVFKLYLARILEEPECGPTHQTQSVAKADLFPLNVKYREMVGQVLAAHSGLGSPGPYIPTFYQLQETWHVKHFCESSKNALMQQPLAHLYFLVVFEHLQNRKSRPNHLVRLAEKIAVFLQKGSTPNARKILLSIEKQAVVQMLIYEVAAFFDPKDPCILHSLFNTQLNERVNPLLADESMGGNSTCISWHALVLAMNLQKQLNNPWKLIRLLSDDNGTLVKAFSIMKPLQSLIQPLSQPECEAHLFPFLQLDDNDLANFYKKICHTVINVSINEKNMDALTKLAKESYSSEHKMKLTTSYGHLLEIDERNAFRMLLWLCVYNEFYVKKLHSRSLADTLSNELRGVLEPQLIGLLESFIYPDYMILPSETSLCNPFDSKQDSTDIELRHSMANMVAIVLACEPRSNHLWYHMFAADTLSGSYMTGFMYPDKISENFLYDCGVELSSDGMYGRPDYLIHATRGTLSLHSLYLILWANFSAFYMALVTQPDAQEKISGPIISPKQHIHHYCIGQLRNAWRHMGDKLSLSPEKHSFFIMQCMERLLEISISQPTWLQPLLKEGKFESSGDLDTYETIWHGHIFELSLKNIHSKFAEHCHLHENKLFQNVRCLETYYPHFPTMDEFTQTMLSSIDVSSIQNKVYVLSIFALEHRRLQAAGALLPDLLELYHWIHNELAYLVTHEDARSDTIQTVIEREDEKYAGLERFQLYERVRDGYNSYVKVVGHYIEAGVGASIKKRETNKIKDSTKFIHFLSVESDDEQREGSDLLYLIIDNIINFHNSFLWRVFRAIGSSEHSSLRKYFPERLEENMYSTEVNDDIMIVPRKSPKDYEVEEHLQRVRSRYLQPTERTTGACPFDLHRLQIDVIQAHLAGKPIIVQSPGDRISFKFKIERPNTFALEGADLNLSVISQGIKEEFKLQLEEEYAGELLCEFHSADYQSLAEVVRGLRVAIEHLKSVLIVNEVQFESKKLPEFLLSVFKEPKTEILEDIGIKHLSPSQLACLQALKLPYLYSTLEQFVNWVKDGMYDFHQLPFVMKKHLEPEDKEVLSMLDTNYEGPTSALLQEIQLITESLVKSESHLKKTITKNMKMSIMTVLKEAKMAEKSELIPDTVLCQHYVALRVILRRKTVDLQSKLSENSHRQHDQGNWWVEQVEDLWTAKLKHLWDIAKPYDYSDRMFQFDPGIGEYGLYGYQIEAVKEQEKKSEEKADKKTPDPETLPSAPLRKEQLEEIAERLSVADIQEFLKTDPKLEKYTKLFEENEVDGSLLFCCTKESLKDLGIKSDFDRTKIISKFKKHLRAKLGQ